MHIAARLPNLANALLLCTVLQAQAASAQTKPALVRHIDRPEAQPIAGSCFFVGAETCMLYAVPAAKTFVVQTVSFHVTPQAQDTSHLTEFVSIYSDDATSMHVNPGNPMYGSGLVGDSGVTPLSMMVRENKTLNGYVHASRGLFNGAPSFSGYLVDK